MSTDQDIINQAVATHTAGKIISDLQARVIAAAWHGGQATALYALASTGTITRNLQPEIRRIHDAPQALAALMAYIHHHGDRGPQPGWSNLRW